MPNQTVTEFPIPAANNSPFSIALGPDGNVWFTEVGMSGAGSGIGRITPGGTITEFNGPGSPGGITAGPDGALWFTEIAGDKIGRMTTAGVVTDEIPITAGSATHEITTGPDGVLWFAEAGKNQIGRIDPTTHVLTEFSAGITAGSAPFDIVSGPDGALWFTEIHGDRIGRITTGGVVTEFAVNKHPSYITVGPDGALWFSESDVEKNDNVNKIGRITTAGVFTEFTPPTAGSKPQGITVGPDGAIWFAEAAGNKIGRLTADGTFNEFPTSSSTPFGIVTGADGHLWFTEFSGNQIGEIAVPPTPPPPAGTTADMVLRRADGIYEIYNVGNNAILASYQLGRVGAEWQFVTLGGFFGSDTADMLLRNSTTGGSYGLG